jgi:hypothetical protein
MALTAMPMSEARYKMMGEDQRWLEELKLKAERAA